MDNLDACLIDANPHFGVPGTFDGVQSSLLPEFSIHADIA
jgi:hypothetical protein